MRVSIKILEENNKKFRIVNLRNEGTVMIMTCHTLVTLLAMLTSKRLFNVTNGTVLVLDEENVHVSFVVAVFKVVVFVVVGVNDVIDALHFYFDGVIDQLRWLVKVRLVGLLLLALSILTGLILVDLFLNDVGVVDVLTVVAHLDTKLN